MVIQLVPLLPEIVHSKTPQGDELLPRSGHRIVADDDNLYVWGGYNPDFNMLFQELWRFNFWSRKWTKLKTTGNVPLELASHTVLKIGKKLLHFGGTGFPFGSASSNDLTILDLRTLEWKLCPCTGDRPTPKYGQTMTYVNNSIYIIGGTTGFVYTMEVHRLDLQSFTWSSLEPTSTYIPEERYRHEVVHHDGRLFMFGGGTGHLTHPLNKVDVFDIERHGWMSVETSPYTVDSNTTEFPSPRRCHSCTKYKTDILMVGGMKEDQILGDIWKFSLTTYQWTKLKNTMSVPVYFHSAAVTPAGCLYVFGGVTEKDSVRTNKLQRLWLQVPSLTVLCWQYLTSVLDMEKVVKNRTAPVYRDIPAQFLDSLL